MSHVVNHERLWSIIEDEGRSPIRVWEERPSSPALALSYFVPCGGVSRTVPAVPVSGLLVRGPLRVGLAPLDRDTYRRIGRHAVDRHGRGRHMPCSPLTSAAVVVTTSSAVTRVPVVERSTVTVTPALPCTRSARLS